MTVTLIGSRVLNLLISNIHKNIYHTLICIIIASVEQIESLKLQNI